MEKSGFFVSPKLFYLGCSPDGKVIDISSIDQFGLVEIKCPSSKFSVTPTEACSDPHFFLEVVDGKPKLKKTMFTMIKSRVKWPSLELNGVILLCIQKQGSALKGFSLMRSTGRKCVQY